MTTGSSIQAITLTLPPHSLHVSMSILPTGTVGKGREQDAVASKTRFKRCAHVIVACMPVLQEQKPDMAVRGAAGI